MPYINILIGLFTGASIAFSSASFGIPINVYDILLAETAIIKAKDIPNVPFYSQFRDIQSAEWQKLGCGIASAAMLIKFYQPENVVSANALLKEGLAAGAFINGAGWSHKGLASLIRKYGLESSAYDLSQMDTNAAFAQFKEFLKKGPVIASVRYKFDPQNPIPHLVVINGIDGDSIYYNDPAGTLPRQIISANDFIKAWKKRFIAAQPAQPGYKA